jgi:predicted nucleotidyltransferase
MPGAAAIPSTVDQDGLPLVRLDPRSRAFAAEGDANGNYGSESMAMTDEDLMEEAGRRLTAAAPDAEIILFGSRAQGEARPDSDLDLLVIEPDFARRGEEYGRLRKELRGLGVAVDLVIYRRREAEEWGGVPGSFLHRVLREGRVLAGA